MSLGNARTAVSRIVRARAGSKQDVRACWYRIVKAKTPGAYVVRIEGDIGVDRDDEGNVIGISAKTFIKQLRAIRDMKTLRVMIFSGGGNVFDGIQIYNELRALSKAGIPVTVRIGALAASIASVIAMAGDVVEIHAESSFMIHDPWMEMAGNAADFRKTATMLDKLRSTMMSAYSRKNPGMPADELEALIKAETWYTGSEAVEAGFADVLISENLDSEALASAAVIVKAMATKPKAKSKAKPKGKAEDEDEPQDSDDEDQPQDSDEDEDQPQDLAGIAAALGAIAETLQEVLDAVTGSDEDEDEPEASDDDEDEPQDDDDEDGPEASDDDDDGEQQARAASRRRARAKARKPVASNKPVNTSSKAYLALKKIAKANGELGSFVTYVAAGASLKKLQAKFLDGESDTKNRVRSTAASARTGIKSTKLDPSAYYANLAGKKKEA